MDIRNPKLDEYLTVPERGITNYLSSSTDKLEDLIVRHDGYDHLCIASGCNLLPNPAELVNGEKVNRLLKLLKNTI
jgi:hypothetical protein